MSLSPLGCDFVTSLLSQLSPTIRRCTKLAANLAQGGDNKDDSILSMTLKIGRIVLPLFRHCSLELDKHKGKTRNKRASIANNSKTSTNPVVITEYCMLC